MKRMLALVLFIGVIFFCNNVNAEFEHVTQKQVKAAQELIQAYGYKCDNVDNMIPFLLSTGFHVYCNNYRYKYDLKDVGGNWKITVK